MGIVCARIRDASLVRAPSASEHAQSVPRAGHLPAKDLSGWGFSMHQAAVLNWNQEWSREWGTHNLHSQHRYLKCEILGH